MPVFNIWTANAVPTAQVWRLLPSNLQVWDVLTVTIGGKPCAYTVTSADATAVNGVVASVCSNFAAALVKMGSTVFEFSEITWEAAGHTTGNTNYRYITATGPADGTPFTLTATASGASSGVAIEVIVVQTGSTAVNEVQVITLGTVTGGTFKITYSGQQTAAIQFDATNYEVRDALCDLSNIGGVNEVQTITITGAPTGGTFTLTYSGQTTAAIAYNATATAVQSALCDLSNIGGVNEVQTLTTTGGPTGGTFTITYAGQTTTAIEVINASASVVQAALEALSNIGTGGVVCTGGPLPTAIVITFSGSLARKNVALMTTTSTALTGGTSPAAAIALTTQGVNADVTTTGGPLPGTAVVVTFKTVLGRQDVPLMTANGAGLTGPSSPYTVTVSLTTGGVASDVTVTGNDGGPYTVTFVNALAATNVPQMSVQSSLTGVNQSTNYTEYLWLPGGNGDADVINLTGANTVTSGTFTLTFTFTKGTTTTTATTAAIQYNATIKTIREAVDAALLTAGLHLNLVMYNHVDYGHLTLLTGNQFGFYFWGYSAQNGYYLTSGSINTGSLVGGTYALATYPSAPEDLPNFPNGVYRISLDSGISYSDYLSFDATAADIRGALERLAAVGTGNVLVTDLGLTTGNPPAYLKVRSIEFVGRLAATNMPSMFVDTSALGGVTARTQPQLRGFSGGVTGSVTTTTDGIPGQNEIQKILYAEPVASGTFTLTYSGQTTSAIAYNATASAVRDALCDLSNILGTDEVQTVTITGGPTGGTFTLTYSGQTTAGIAYNATASAVQSALEALSNIEVGDVVCAGGPLPGTAVTVTFRANLGRQNVAEMTANSSGLTGGTTPTATVTTTTAGVASDVTVTGSAGGPWTVTFVSALAGTNVVTLTGNGANLNPTTVQGLASSVITAPSGKNWWNIAQNWSLNTVPANGEWVVFQNSDVSCKFGISQAAVNPEKLIIDSTFTGEIGLPKWNSLGYYEYRDTALRLGTDGSGPASLTIEIGEGEGEGSPLIRLNTGNKLVYGFVKKTGSSSEDNQQSINWIGTHASSEWSDLRGSLGIGSFAGEVATVAAVRMSYIDSQDSDADVVIGNQVTCGTIEKNGGSLDLHCASTSLIQHFGTTRIYGSGAQTIVKVFGGTVHSNTTGILGHYGAITGITQANPAVVTSTAHGLTTGDKIRIGGVVGMTQVNQVEYSIAVVNANSFQLVGINSSAYTAYSSGGTWARIGSVIVSGSAILDFNQSLAARQVAIAIDVYGDDAKVRDVVKKVTTTTYLTGEFAIHRRPPTRDENLGTDYIQVRRV